MEYPKSKKVGDIGEEEILKKILPKYPKAFIDDIGKANSKWDIYIPEIGEGIEVKIDFKSNYSHNILIETEFDGRPSALSLTEAKYWVIITGYRYIWITPLQIYRFLELHPYFGRVFLTGKGDNVSKIAHLPTQEKFLQYVRSLDKKNGWVDMIEENEILYYKRFSKSGSAEDIDEDSIYDENRILDVLNIKA